VGHVESRFGPFGDSFGVGARYLQVCAKHTVGSEIVLDAPNGTPRLRGSSGCLTQSIRR
jgi:hypothetical protein